MHFNLIPLHAVGYERPEFAVLLDDFVEQAACYEQRHDTIWVWECDTMSRDADGEEQDALQKLVWKIHDAEG